MIVELELELESRQRSAKAHVHSQLQQNGFVVRKCGKVLGSVSDLQLLLVVRKPEVANVAKMRSELATRCVVERGTSGFERQGGPSQRPHRRQELIRHTTHLLECRISCRRQVGTVPSRVESLHEGKDL